ncbi:MAG: hypothetical protein ACREID_00225, partial [Planctomycetota bacterium]
SEATARAARDAGMRSVHWSPDVVTAAAHPPFRPRAKDVILFKASRGIGLEALVDTLRDELRPAHEARPSAAEPREESVHA